MDTFSWLVCLVLFLVLFQVSRKLGRTNRLPPGPPAIPIFGNLFQLGDKPHRTLAELAKVHGDIMTVKFGQTTTIVLSSETMAKEILQTHDAISCNRTVPDALRALQHHEAGIAWMPVSTTWRNLRKICSLHIFASQKLDANQHLRRYKVEQLLADVRDSSRIGESLEISTVAFKTTLNLMSNTIFSVDYAYSSSNTALEFKEILQVIKEELGKANFGDLFPTLSKLDLQGIRRRMAIHSKKMMRIFDKEIDKRSELRKMNDYIPAQDFLDTLLQISEDDNEEFDRNLIKHLLFDLFTAGTDTVTSTLEWAMAELLHNPKALQEVRRELQQIVGKGNVVEESDVTRLLYLQAIVKETLRLHPPVPFLLPRKAEVDIKIHNFVIPKGAQVLINAWAIGRDPNFWEEPELFSSERFIESEIDVKGTNFGLIPFGGGRRICPGLPLAIRMLPLMLGTLIHSFDWELEDGKPHKSLANLAKIHGDIMTVKLGQTTTIVLSSETMAKEILQTHDAISCNRTVPDALRALQHHEAGLVWMPVSTTWINLRKICNLHIFASQKLDANQHLRQSKVEQLLTDVRDSSRIGEAIEISTAVFKTSLDLLSNTVFSIDFADSSSHSTALEFRETMQAFKEEFGKPNFSDFFPTLLAKLDLQGIRRRVTIHFEKIMKLFDKEIEKRLELRKMNDYIPTNDFLDILLQISQDDNEELDRNKIKHLIFDLFTAGTDTTTSTLEWAMAELLHNPKALLEARRELRQIIGKGNVVDESDVIRLPYLQAIVNETLRLHPPVPFLIPRKAEVDIKIHNFVIPKGAQVLINAWAIGRDPSIWEEPDLFHPERFIGSDIDVKGRNFGLIPFGAGRRICPGLPLAIRMLHLILGRLIHSFVWELEDGITPESLNMDDKYGIVLQKDQPLKIIAHSV
ncbi:hypothetical protein J1N35_010079 [Gossypium stocksii]|uniref:Cytochrome P450 n=1 Tax=Gossypium stocksii TaxID=47602 RepID=A0A9D3VZ93_9ROSI|nr:hypothetical protein J1N35_010079 [Gossypium stocksii]